MVMLRYLALGDSYTIGTGVQLADSWPWQLATALRSEGSKLADPVIIAQNGWTSTDLLSGINNAGLQSGFDLLTLLIGVNDQYRNHQLAHYKEMFAELLDCVIHLGEKIPDKVIVLSIPDWGVTPYAAGHQKAEIAAEIDAFNDANRLASQCVGCHYVDITQLSRVFGGETSLLTDDGLHPNGMFYRQWIALVLPVARKILSRDY